LSVATTTSSTADPTDEALRKQLLAASQELAALKKALAAERKGKATVDRQLTAMAKQTAGASETADNAKQLAALRAENIKLRAEHSDIQSKLDKSASHNAAIQGGLQKKLNALLKKLESARASTKSDKPSHGKQEVQKLLAEIKALKGERTALAKRLQTEGEAAKRRKVEADGAEPALREAKETIKALQAKASTRCWTP
jgi:regulator of replication initiation timing